MLQSLNVDRPTLFEPSRIQHVVVWPEHVEDDDDEDDDQQGGHGHHDGHDGHLVRLVVFLGDGQKQRHKRFVPHVQHRGMRGGEKQTRQQETAPQWELTCPLLYQESNKHAH